MAKQLSLPKWSFPNNGNSAAGYYVYFYEAGTTTAKDTYTSYDEGTANSNPVVLDARGEADIWLSGTYKIAVYTGDKDAGGTLVWTVDNYGEGEEPVLSGNFNVVKNGSFEFDTVSSGEPDDWTIVDYTGGSHSLDATDQFHGLNSLKFTSTGTGGGYATSAYFEVREGATLNFDWAMKSSVADVRNVVDVLWYTSAKTLISTTNLYDDSTTNPTSWTGKNGTAVVVSTGRYAQIRVYGCHSSDVTAGSTWYDDFRTVETISTAAGTVYDSNGNEAIIIPATASAVNEITVTNSATGNAVDISATGDDTNIDLTLSGKGTGRVIIPFRGALVYHDASQIIASGVATNLSFNSEDYDTDSIHDTVTNNSRLTVPTGVTRVKLKASFSISDVDAPKLINAGCDIKKNGSSIYNGYTVTSPDVMLSVTGWWNMSSPVLLVTGGDYFELKVSLSTSDASSITIQSGGGGTWFAMEIIE